MSQVRPSGSVSIVRQHVSCSRHNPAPKMLLLCQCHQDLSLKIVQQPDNGEDSCRRVLLATTSLTVASMLQLNTRVLTVATPAYL